MRHSSQAGRGRRLPIWAAGLFALVVAACGSAAPASAPPTPAPTPTATPDPHLKEPVTADEIFLAFGKAGVTISAINANLGQGNPDIVKQINANIGGWPLRIIQYQSSAVLTRALAWTPGQPPHGDQAPYNFAGLNILVEYGPISARAPSLPDAGRQKDAAAIVGVLDPLLWPITQRSVQVIPSRTPMPAATPAPTAKPSAKPSTKVPAKTPKPTTKP
jgi:hypothetical protein